MSDAEGMNARDAVAVLLNKRVASSFKDAPMKPIVILPPGAMSKEDVDRLRENELCVVEAQEPGLVKFLDPIPAISSRTEIENAAIGLSRKVLDTAFWSQGRDSAGHQAMVRTFVEILIRGTSLDIRPSRQELEAEIFDEAKVEELKRLAREEAKAERAAAKAMKQNPPAEPAKK